MNQGDGFGGLDVLFCLTGLVIWGPICAIVLSKKGRSGFGGYVLGALLGLIGLLIAALLSADHVELANREAKGNAQINGAIGSRAATWTLERIIAPTVVGIIVGYVLYQLTGQVGLGAGGALVGSIFTIILGNHS
jgi:hypothetical protein